MTQEQKAKAYDMALDKIERLLDICDNCSRKELEHVFPELKKFEGERIRKSLIDYLHTLPNHFSHNGGLVTDWIAWLEEQGEQQSNDKAEQKFHEGDWITNGDYTWQIVNATDLDYILQSQDGNIVDDTISHVDEQFHSFTIQDAKDGDVIFTSSTASHETFIFKNIDENGNVECYFAYDSEDGFREGKYHFIGRATNSKPATKEQYDALMKAMSKAGYEWDAENKQLKKIKQKSTEWSEEKRQIIEDAACCILSCVNTAETKKEEESLEELADKLQDLRPLGCRVMSRLCILGRQ